MVLFVVGICRHIMAFGAPAGPAPSVITSTVRADPGLPTGSAGGRLQAGGRGDYAAALFFAREPDAFPRPLCPQTGHRNPPQRHERHRELLPVIID